jgi:hypothetical protein
MMGAIFVNIGPKANIRKIVVRYVRFGNNEKN